MILYVFIWLAFAMLCAIIASSKGRSAGGWALAGLLFGPLAFLLLVASGRAEEREPVINAAPRSRDPFKRS